MHRLTTLIVAALLALPAPLWAGSAATGERHFEPERIAQFAKAVEHYAAAAGARAFIIARVGRPPEELPEGIRFTHTAIAVYSQITLANGEIAKGYAIHNLYQEEQASDRSRLLVDYPTDFFWPAAKLKAGILIPEPELQIRLIELLASEGGAAIHNPRYSAISNPFNSRYQNCTEYTLDMINAAIYQTTDTAQLKANARAHFTASRIGVSRLRLSLGSLFNEEVSGDDHRRRVETATFSSIAQYLADNGLALQSVILHESGATEALAGTART